MRGAFCDQFSNAGVLSEVPRWSLEDTLRDPLRYPKTSQNLSGLLPLFLLPFNLSPSAGNSSDPAADETCRDQGPRDMSNGSCQNRLSRLLSLHTRTNTHPKTSSVQLRAQSRHALQRCLSLDGRKCQSLAVSSRKPFCSFMWNEGCKNERQSRDANRGTMNARSMRTNFCVLEGDVTSNKRW